LAKGGLGDAFIAIRQPSDALGYYEAAVVIAKMKYHYS